MPWVVITTPIAAMSRESRSGPKPSTRSVAKLGGITSPEPLLRWWSSSVPPAIGLVVVHVGLARAIHEGTGITVNIHIRREVVIRLAILPEPLVGVVRASWRSSPASAHLLCRWLGLKASEKQQKTWYDFFEELVHMEDFSK